jgi:AraC family transcriptional regulator
MNQAAALSGRVLREFRTEAGSIAETDHPSAALPAHSHPQTTICRVLRGELFEAGRVFRANDVIFRHPGQPHADEFGSDGARCFNIVLDKTPPQFRQFHAAEPVVRRLARELRRGPSALVVEGLLYQLIGEISREPASSGVARAASKLIHQRFTGPLSLRAIADELGVHPVHLTRSFRREFGATLVDAVEILRIAYAKELLAGPLPIAEIALASGFADQSHFTKVFRRATGTTPRRYRIALSRL